MSTIESIIIILLSRFNTPHNSLSKQLAAFQPILKKSPFLRRMTLVGFTFVKHFLLFTQCIQTRFTLIIFIITDILLVFPLFRHILNNMQQMNDKKKGQKGSILTQGLNVLCDIQHVKFSREMTSLVLKPFGLRFA